MTDAELFELLTSKSGGFSLPVLVSITDGETELCYVNSRNDVVMGGKTYKAEVFQFSASADVLGFFGGGTLEIARTFDVVSILERNDTVTISIKGILYNGEAVELYGYTSRYCKAVLQVHGENHAGEGRPAIAHVPGDSLHGGEQPGERLAFFFR